MQKSYGDMMDHFSREAHEIQQLQQQLKSESGTHRLKAAVAMPEFIWLVVWNMFFSIIYGIILPIN